MNSPVPPVEIAPWLELANRWQQFGHEWAQWWACATAAVTPPPLAATHTTASAAPGSLPALVDPQALVALNAKYQPRFEALWSAAQAALIAGQTSGGAAALPDLVHEAPGDRRFIAAEWSELPFFALMKQYYLLAAEYLEELAAIAPLPPQDRKRLEFVTRQTIDALAPTNFPATNPEVIKRAVKTEGASLVQGLSNLVADARKGRITMTDERAFALGRNIAMTPGHVVFRNDLIELIQYAPTTPEVHRSPLLIVPPCINKYYILDLQPEDSFVRWTVAQGQTVFMISWRNVPPELGHLAWDDYITEGVLTAIRVARAIGGGAAVNALGFCVGGTLLASALAVLAARRERSVACLTLLTTLLEFSDPGEIGVYVSREMLAAREPLLLAGQRVHGSEIARAFASLRANDLVWKYVVDNYLKGETPPAFDLLYWNSDPANLPGPMYAYYLRNMYLDNRLRERGALTMAGESIDLARIGMPAYVFASREDHIVPWRSAYATTSLLGGDPTFVLGASGHIAGVVNPPAKRRRNYWLNAVVRDDADAWLARAASEAGSWWPHWAAWLAPHAGAMKPAPAEAGGADYPALEPAPGRYVRLSAD